MLMLTMNPSRGNGRDKGLPVDLAVDEPNEQDDLLRKHLQAVDDALEIARESIAEVKRALRFPLASSTREENHRGPE